MSLIDKLTSLFNSNSEEPDHVKPILDQLNTIYQLDWSVQTERKKELFDLLKSKDAQFKVDFTYNLIRQYNLRKVAYSYHIGELLTTLHRSNIIQSEQDFIRILAAISESIKQDRLWPYYAPIILILKQFERFAAQQPLSPDTVDFLRTLLATGELSSAYNAKDADKVKSILSSLVQTTSDSESYPPVVLDDDDYFGKTLNQFIQQTTPDQRNILYGLLAHYKKASGAKPSGKYNQEAQKLYAQLGDSVVYTGIIRQWLAEFNRTEVQSETHTNNYNGRDYTYTSHSFLHEINAIIAKGIVWSLVGLAEQDAELLKLLPEVAEKSYQKIPGQGPAAASVGNACLYVLAESGITGVGQLSRLKLRIKQANTQTLIEKYIQEASEKLGVSPQVIEDMAVADYGLVNGTLTQLLGDYRAEVAITGIGKVDLRWFKADGTLLKSEPASVKKEFAADLKTLKSTVADIAKNTTAQRDRLDRSMLLDRRWTWQEFSDYYATHGLMSFLAQRLIWTVEKGDQTADIFHQNDTWADLNGNAVDWLDTNTTVRLWHPVGKPVDTVIAWREFLNQHEIRQPLKQAYREVYLLTDAELNTRLYSNRMAAHILKQHQFNTLAKGRGWRYSLLGAYDKGYESDKARIDLPAYDLKAEFWVSEVDADDAWNDTGIYLYVSTDQVRFTRLNDDNRLPLIDIPPLVFSEIMRDVDLFVGVASVGNDPNWRDGGLTQYRNYWESYSFGELGELAKSRKQAVERLLPRLKIARVAEVRDKFLVVRGKLRTYKIHLGSGNILMEPNGQYLCIVPDRGADKVTNNVFLPFEGDTVLSIVLSKAFLLADDDKITDKTITRQIAG